MTQKKVELSFYQRELEIYWSRTNYRRLEKLSQFLLIRELYHSYPEPICFTKLLEKTGLASRYALQFILKKLRPIFGDGFPYLVKSERPNKYVLVLRSVDPRKNKRQDHRQVVTLETYHSHLLIALQP